MKKLALFLLIGGLFTSCNDGDFVFDELNFSGNIQKCSQKDIYYKLNNNEMLFTYLPDVLSTNLTLNQEYTYPITNSNTIIYRQYADKAIQASICDIITPAFPQVVEEFLVNPGGQIKYKYTRNITQNEAQGKVNIDYYYNINFHNIVLSNGTNELKYENYFFGEFKATPLTFDFNLGNALVSCDAQTLVSTKGNQIFKISSSQLNFPEQAGTQTINLNETNFINFYYVNSVTSKEEACSLEFTNSNTLILEQWKATSGTLEIVTTANSTIENPNIITGYTYSFYLKNVTFNDSIDSFTITNQLIGTYKASE